MNADLLRIVDSICRDKNIEREVFMQDLETAMISAVRKHYETEEATVVIDPLTGSIEATVEGRALSIQELGRIAAQTAKQVIIQRTRERERAGLFEEYTERRGTVVSGVVQRIERGNLIVNIGRTDAFLPRSEQIPGETHQIGDRIRALIYEVRELPNQVKIVLSRGQEEFIQRLFEVEVPEVAERVIEIRAMAREPGYRTKVAVSSIDSKVDAVGACVGVRGSRIKNIVDELNNEKIDIVRWNESSQILIQNALKPAEVDEISLCLELGKATVVVKEDQLSLAIGKRGQNVRLAARLTGWDINITTPEQHTKALEIIADCLRSVEGVDELLIDKVIALGAASVQDIDDIGPEPIIEALEISADLAERICEAAGEETIRLLEEKEESDKLAAIERAKPKPPPSAFVAEEGGEEASDSAAASEEPGATAEAPTDSAAEAPADSAAEADAPDASADDAAPVADEAPKDETAPTPSAFVPDDVEETKTSTDAN